MEYFYDGQLRRFAIQFARIWSEWKYYSGQDALGNPIYKRIPVKYGDASRNAATIIAQNSASSMPNAPMITWYISGVEYDQRRTQDPFYVDKVSVRQRSFNPETGEYETTQGDAFTVQRLMPVPYTLRMNVDIWSTNEQQRHEIFEQVGVLFNPSMEIQSTDNFIDWTSLSVVYQDGITWNSRSIPAGTGNDINITTWKFYMPVWVSSPIKVQKLGIIHRIIASIHKGAAISDIQDDDLLLGTRQKITPYGYQLLLIGNQLQILPQGQPEVPPNNSEELPTPPDTAVYWQAVVNSYGTLRPGISQIRIQNEFMEYEIVGTVAFNPTDDRLMIYNIDEDTLPKNTLPPIDRIIDPTAKIPGDGLDLPANGQRYLIVTDIGSDNYQMTVTKTPTAPVQDGVSAKIYVKFLPQGTTTQSFAVGTLIQSYDQYNEPYLPANTTVETIGEDEAGLFITVNNGDPNFRTRAIPANTYLKTNIWSGSAWGQFYSSNGIDAIPIETVPRDSIIEYDGVSNRWFVAFEPALLSDIQYVTNLFTNIQYRWADNYWGKAWEGYYNQGSWDIVI